MSDFKKKCKSCGKTKLASLNKDKSEYGRSPHTKDGFLGVCRVCHGANISRGKKSGKISRSKKPKSRVGKTILRKAVYDLKDVLWTHSGEVIYHQGIEIAIASNEAWAKVIAETRNDLIKARVAIQIFEQLKQFISKDLLEENEKLKEEVARLKDLTSKKEPIPKPGNGGSAHKRDLRLDKRYPLNKEFLMNLIKERESSVTQIAKVINKTDVCLYNYMNGVTDCKMGDIQELADYFEVDVAHLIDKQKYKNGKEK